MAPSSENRAAVMRRRALAAATIIFSLAIAAAAQSAERHPVAVEQIIVHGASLENNLEEDSPDRDVTVFLPPSYAKEPTRRFPVVYGLHGYTINNEIWADEIKATGSLEGAFAAGVREVILVLPNAQTLHNGSMYSSSITTGDWESFIAEDLVAYIDAHYRTIAARESRGLVGHSMGGYGATRIGMKRPDVFGALYIMSPCCMSARGAPPDETLARLAAVKTKEEAASMGFLERATFAVAAAWSPNPDKPPFFADLPTGDRKASVLANWAANAPLSMASQYIYNLRKYRAIAIDVGDQDGLRVDAAELHRILDDSGVPNTFAIYEGDHVNRVSERFEDHVLPFFDKNLSHETGAANP